MIHPSYVDLMKVVNKDVEEGETPVINSRYSIVMATAKRAHQIVDGDEPLVKVSRGEKPLSIAVDELNQGEIRILAEDEVEEDYIEPGESAEEDDVVTDGEDVIADETVADAVVSDDEVVQEEVFTEETPVDDEYEEDDIVEAGEETE